MTRQAKYQKRLSEAGKCISCRTKCKGPRCARCREIDKERARKRYRENNGIALDAPLYKRQKREIIA